MSQVINKSSRALDPRLPWDIEAAVIRQTDWDTLKTLSLVCRDFDQEAGRYLWRVVTIHTLGQGYDEARSHVELKLRVIRRHVRHVRDISLGIYSGYSTFWQSEHDVADVLEELFSLLNETCVSAISMNLDAYGPAVERCLRTFCLPPSLRALTLCNGTQTNIQFLRDCLPNLETLSLRSTHTGVNNKDVSLGSLLLGGALPKLRTLEVDRPAQLASFRECALPALETLSVVSLCRLGLEEILIDFMVSLSVPKSTYPAPMLRNLHLRATCSSAGRPTPATLYNSLLLCPAVRASGVFAHLRTISLVHDQFPCVDVQDEALGQLFHEMKELEEFSWEIMLGSLGARNQVHIGEKVLCKAFSADREDACCKLKELTLRVSPAPAMFSQKSWMRKYRRHDTDVVPGVPACSVVEAIH